MTVINTNVKSLVAQASLAANSKNQATAMERLSTGSRINSAKDDAAGLAIGSRMTSQVRGLNMAIRNANDGISLAQTAEGALDETTSMLQRMRELSVQASNGVNSASDRAALNAEVQQLKAEIDRIASTTKFNGQNVLDGSMNATLQIGDQVGQSMQLAVGNMATAAMGETASGLAAAATKASLTVSGVSANVADYSGVSFNAAVNGVSKTVTLPTAAPVATSIQAAFVSNDKTQSIKPQQVGAFSERTVNISTHSTLKISVNDGDTATYLLDMKPAAVALGYDTAKMTGANFVSALQSTINSSAYFTGNNAVTVGLDINDNLTFDVAGGAKKIVIGDGSSGTLVSTIVGDTNNKIAIGTTLHAVTLAATPLDASEKFGMENFRITQATNDLLGIKIGNGTKVVVDLVTATTLFDTMADVASHIQTKLNTHGAFQGNNALTVSAVKDDNQKWGLTFVSAVGAQVTLDDTFMTTAAGTGGVNVTATVLPTSTTSVTLNPVKQFGQLSEKTINLTDVYSTAGAAVTTSMEEFRLNVNNGGDVVISMEAALTSMALTETVNRTVLTGDQFTRAMQSAINDTGLFVGDNAVTVGINSSGQVTMAVAGGVGAISVKEVQPAARYDGLVKVLTGTNNGVVGNASEVVTSGGSLVLGAAYNAAVAVSPAKPPGEISFVITGSSQTGAQSPMVFTDALGNVTKIDPLLVVTDSTGTTALVNAQFAAVAGHATNDPGDVASQYVMVGAGHATNDATFTIKRKDGVDFTMAMGTTNANGVVITGDASGSTKLLKGGVGVSSAEQVETFGLATTLLGAGTGGTYELQTAVFSGTVAAGSSVNFDGFSFTTDASHAGALAANYNKLADDIVSAFNASGNTDWVASRSASATVLWTATKVGNNPVTAAGVTGVAGLAVGNAGSADGTNPTYNLEDRLTFKLGDDQAINVDLGSSDVTYSSMAQLQTLVQGAIDGTQGLTGNNRVVVGLSTDAVSGKQGLTFTQATGQKLAVSGSFVTGELREPIAGAWTIETINAGGIDLSADNAISVTVANADNGSSITKSITLGSSSANVSLADYASLVQSGINAAFSSDGYSVTASSGSGNFNLALDQSGAKTITVAGASVTAAVGGSQSATGASASSMTTMADVVAEINADLGGDAVASYDAATGAISFAVVAGEAGAGSSVTLSGAGLSAIQFGGTLTAAGSAGEASASRLSTITVDTIANANAATSSIDNAIEYVNSQRASLGAIQNRLDHTVSNLTNISTNTEAARSRIMDADYGQESAALAKAQIIQQAATAMLAQANQSSQSVLSLLQ